MFVWAIGLNGRLRDEGDGREFFFSGEGRARNVDSKIFQAKRQQREATDAEREANDAERVNSHRMHAPRPASRGVLHRSPCSKTRRYIGSVHPHEGGGPTPKKRSFAEHGVLARRGEVRGAGARLRRSGRAYRVLPSLEPDEGLEKLKGCGEGKMAVSLQTAGPSARVTGLENNLRGFNSSWRRKVGPGGRAQTVRDEVTSIDAKLEDDEVVEVDVIAQDGALWIECKAEKAGRRAWRQARAAARRRAPCSGRTAPRRACACSRLRGNRGEAGCRDHDTGGGALGSEPDPEALPPPPPPRRRRTSTSPRSRSAPR